jgi:CheY-like chemotaxis protein
MRLRFIAARLPTTSLDYRRCLRLACRFTIQYKWLQIDTQPGVSSPINVARSASNPDETALGRAKRPRIVIAEDFVLIQENIRVLLEPECDLVAVVEDGEAALAAVASHEPDVLLIDVSLPGVSGFAVAKRLSELRSPVKIIFVTAHNDRLYVKQAFDIGAKGYVLKGAMRSELPAAIRAVMGGGVYRSPLIP